MVLSLSQNVNKTYSSYAGTKRAVTPRFTICLLIWVANIETSHMFQSNKNKSYRGHLSASVRPVILLNISEVSAILSFIQIVSKYFCHKIAFSQLELVRSYLGT